MIGLPVRLTISKRTVEQGKVEFKRRGEAKAEVVPLEEAQARIRAGLGRGAERQKGPAGGRLDGLAPVRAGQELWHWIADGRFISF